MTYRVFAYVRADEMLEYEFDNLEDALDEMRKEWQGHPRRLEMPDGTNYKFKDEEWLRRVNYKWVVLKDKPRTAPQNYLLKQLNKNDSLRFMLLSLRHPQNIESVIDAEGEGADDADCKEIRETKQSALLQLISYDLIGLCSFAEGVGIRDLK